MDLRDKIRDIPDFPKPGILFRDITPLLMDPEYFKAAVDEMQNLLSGVPVDALAAMEARGFVLAAPMAYAMGKPLILARKAGKLPYRTLRAEYSLEYGTAAVEVHEDVIAPGSRVAVIDDLLATGGTARALGGLIEKAGGVVVSMVFLAELEGLNGREALAGYEIKTLLKYV